MTVRDINCCSNVWSDTEVLIDQNTMTVYEGKFIDIPEAIANKEVWFWNSVEFTTKKEIPRATKIFVALR